MDYDDDSYMSEHDGNSYGDEAAGDEIIGAPIDEDGLDQFLQRGRSVRAVLHPFLNESLAWISTNRIPKSKAEAQQDQLDRPEAFIYQAYGTLDETHDQQRTTFVLDCAGIFEELQITYNDEQEANLSQMAAKYSKLYKDKIDHVLAQLQKRGIEEGLNEADREWQSTLIDSIFIWCCAEAIYLVPNGTLLCDGLMDWVNRSNPQPSEEDGQDILAARTPYLHPGFWDFVCKGVVRGLFDMVGTFLQDSGLINTNSTTARVVNDLCLLLRTCPRVSSYVGRVQDFRERHKIWRAKVSMASKDLDITDPELETAFKQVYELLKGDKDAVHRQCDTWQECLAALAFLFDPAGVRSPTDVKSLFEMITESDDFGLAVDRTLAIEEACAALCSNNIPRAITKSKVVDLALATHLADLLEKAEILDDIRSTDLDLTLRDILVLDMGEACMSQRGTWQAAVSYWRTAGDVGLDSIQAVITRIPATTQTVVDELLTICQDTELMDEAAEIESIWARKLESEGYHNQAILAYDRAGNVHQIDRLNWELFRKSLIAGGMISQDEELRESLQSPQTTQSTAISTLMAPYAALAMMYQLKDINDTNLAATHLAALLASPDVPKEYVPLLMAEMLPFLTDDSQIPFSSRELFDSLAAIEEFHDSEHYQAGLALLESAMQKPAPKAASLDWRAIITPKFSEQDVLSLVRVKLAKGVGTKFCT